MATIRYVNFNEITYLQLTYLIDNLRELDAREVVLTGFDADKLIEETNNRASVALVALVDNVPAAMIGAVPEDNHVELFFVGTPVVDQFPIFMHRSTKAFLSDISQTYPDMKLVAYVFHEYYKSIKWLHSLGFYFSLNSDTFMVYYFDRHIQTRKS